MKLSIETCVMRDRYGDIKGLEMIKNAGFDCIDYSYYWLKEGSPVLGENFREYAAELRAHLDSLGLECNQAHAPFSFKYGEAMDESTPAYLDIVRAVESASILGAENIIIHSIGIPDDVKDVDVEEYNLTYYKSLEPYAKKFGICISVENLFASDKKRKTFKGRFNTPEELCRIVKRLDSSCFTACIDVGHASMTGLEPEAFIGGMEKGLLKALHIQDGDYLGDRHTLPYLGLFNWNAIMKALKAIEYDGELTFEIFKYLKNIPDAALPTALSLAEKTGRELIAMFEG